MPRTTIVPRTALPARIPFDRGGKRRRELVDVLNGLRPGVVARIEESAAGQRGEPTDAWTPGDVAGLLLEVAAHRGDRVTVWEDGTGAVFAALAEPASPSPPR